MSCHQSCHFLLDHLQFTLIHGLNIASSYAILFFTILDFTFTTRHIHSWVSRKKFLLWPRHFILTGAISNCPLLFPSSILDSFWPGGLIQCHIYLPFNIGVGRHFLFQETTFSQNSSLWLFHLGWPCMAWLVASLNYVGSFAPTRLWSMKGHMCIMATILESTAPIIPPSCSHRPTSTNQVLYQGYPIF